VWIRHLEVEKVRLRMERGEKLNWVLLHLYVILDSVISLGVGEAALGGIMILIWGGVVYFRAKF
jgi:hypothetical protein